MKQAKGKHVLSWVGKTGEMSNINKKNLKMFWWRSDVKQEHFPGSWSEKLKIGEILNMLDMLTVWGEIGPQRPNIYIFNISRVLSIFNRTYWTFPVEYVECLGQNEVKNGQTFNIFNISPGFKHFGPKAFNMSPVLWLHVHETREMSNMFVKNAKTWEMLNMLNMFQCLALWGFIAPRHLTYSTYLTLPLFFGKC